METLEFFVPVGLILFLGLVVFGMIGQEKYFTPI